MNKILIIIISAIIMNLNAISNDEKYVIVGGDKVNLRESAGLGSKILKTMDLGHMVIILKRSKETVTIDGKKGRWAYVDSRMYDVSKDGRSENDKTIKGWVFDYYLYDKSKFVKLSSFNPMKIGVTCSGGDIYFEVSINGDGSFLMKDIYQLGSSADHERYCKESCGIYDKSEPNACYHKGALYQHNNIIWAKIEGVPDGGNEYYVVDKNEIRYISYGTFDSSTRILK
ncbi:MAG TPA: SH3 domain-containing protein [Spirochaetota bacterium]|nr:SH3 domain-containing protein [Spirochaetota bacterium]HOR45697.1 SH3 domain-containing protein [Spirochaetota bacterium]HPK57323.1 SH3 domain-containing protein [Spirochaetota bacterium]